MQFKILFYAFSLAGLPGALAWGAVGHEVVATIAQIHLHPSVFPAMCTVLNYTSKDPDEPQCHLAPVATWADKLRFKMRWSAPLHYIGSPDDYPPSTCLFPGARGWEGRRGSNVLGAIRNDSDILQAWVSGALSAQDPDRSLVLANEALRFLIHFLGDMHQPLHLTGRDRGGNSDKVLFDKRETNLHSVWDTNLIAKSLRTMGRNYTKPLPIRQIEYNLRGTIYDPYVRRIMWEGILGQWKDEISSWLVCPPQEALATPKFSTFPFLATVWHKSISLWQLLTDTAAEETDDDILCPYHWAQPVHRLNCDIVWPKALDEPPYKQHPVAPHQPELEHEITAFKGPLLELDTPDYAGVIARDWVIEKLLAQAGIRLAAILNRLFADPAADPLFGILVDV